MSTDRPLVIVNPKAGRMGGADGVASMTKVIEAAIGAVDVAVTERSRHASEIARDAARAGRGLVIATGGDGSIHEVVNGLMEARETGSSNTQLGIIGRGTGSDLCKTLGIEPRLDRALSVIAARCPKRIDVGRFRYKDRQGQPASAYFVNILSVGMGGLVDEHVRRTTRWASGPVAYFVASARALLQSQVGILKVRTELNGQTTERRIESRQISICNGRYFGSGMHIAPMAKPDDGIFEVVDLGPASRLKFATSSSAIYRGDHLKSPDVQHMRCTKIDVELLNKDVSSVFLLDVDGEPLGELPLSVEVMPQALEVLLPP